MITDMLRHPALAAGFVLVLALLSLTLAAWVKLEIHWNRTKKMRNQ